MYAPRLLLIGLTLALTASRAQAALQTFDDKAAFLTATGAATATGPLPDLGERVETSESATVVSITFSLALGRNNFFIGANGTGAAPEAAVATVIRRCRATLGRALAAGRRPEWNLHTVS